MLKGIVMSFQTKPIIWEELTVLVTINKSQKSCKDGKKGVLSGFKSTAAAAAASSSKLKQGCLCSFHGILLFKNTQQKNTH